MSLEVLSLSFVSVHISSFNSRNISPTQALTVEAAEIIYTKSFYFYSPNHPHYIQQSSIQLPEQRKNLSCVFQRISSQFSHYFLKILLLFGCIVQDVFERVLYSLVLSKRKSLFEPLFLINYLLNILRFSGKNSIYDVGLIMINS